MNEADYSDGVDLRCLAYGHDEVETYRDEELVQYVCERCGAELEDTL